MRRDLSICLLLTGITLIAFWPVGHLGFIILDDTSYVTQNPNVQAGITAQSVGWAFTSTLASNWHPVTWLSHMLDYRLFGLKASGHHWMSLGFHIANTLLLYIVLRKMPGLGSDSSAAVAAPQRGTVWVSAWVAALFALHPLRIESVAWVSERKDVLSGFFFLLTLWAYARYVQKRSRVEGRESRAGSSRLALDPRRWTLDFWLTLVFFALGLMSKPMLVTVPVILLLLDFWPLGRVTRLRYASARQAGDKNSTAGPSTLNPQLSTLLLEKWPFVALSLASGIITIWAQGAGGAISDLNHVPLDSRFENVPVAYAAYLGKILWPVNLSIFYPYAEAHPGEIFGCVLLLAGLSVFCLWRVRSQPYLLAGWGWFVVMLLPVIGMVQVGRQSIADRYTYLPSIGLFLMAAWGMASLASISRLWRTGTTLGAAGVLLACLLDTRYQLRYWRDSITLFNHSIEVTRENNCVGHWILGNAFLESGNLEAAVMSYQSALQIAPNFEEAHYQFGYVLLRQEKFAEAEIQFSEAVRLDQNNADAHTGLGHALVNQRKYAEAAVEYANALALRPNDATISQALAVATLKAESEKALTNFYEVLKVQPTPEVHIQIAAILTIQGRFQEAVEHYLAALELKPDSSDVLNNLAWLLATCPDTHVRNGAQAVKYAGRACELTNHRETVMIGTLAAAYAEAGRFDEAVATAQKACALASESGQQALLNKNQELLDLYRQHRPYRDGANPNPAAASADAPSSDSEKPVSHAP